MSKRKWYTKAIYLAVALAMTVGLLMVPAAVASPESEPAASPGPDVTCATLASCVNGEAVWVAGETHTGAYTPKLDQTGGTSGDLHVEFTPAPGTTLSDLAALTNEWSFWYYLTGTLWGPQLELKFGDPGSTRFVDITVMAAQAEFNRPTDQWVQITLEGTLENVGYWSPDPAIFDDGDNQTLADAVAAVLATAIDGDWELTTVKVQLYMAEGLTRTCHTDEVTIDGTTYDLEPCYIIIPGTVAKDVKGAEQKFVVLNLEGGMSLEDFEDLCVANPAAAMEAAQQECAIEDGNGVCVVGVSPSQVVGWEVIPGLEKSSVGNPGSGADIIVTAGGGPTYPLAGANNPKQNWIRIWTRDPGDCNVVVWLDEDVRLIAEKKWGDIDHTILDLDPSTPIVVDPITKEIISGQETWIGYTPGTDLYPEWEYVDDWVFAWFYKSPVPSTFIDSVGHAVVHWWLIVDDEEGLNEVAIDAIMADLGPDGCGTYADWPAAWGTPFSRIDAIETADPATEFVFSDVTEGIFAPDPNIDGTFNVVGDTYIKTMTENDLPFETRGLVEVELENTGRENILIVTLSEYPWPYAGENPVCIEKGKKGAPPPPPTVEKLPNILWAGEKDVIEWRLEDFDPNTQAVVFYLEDPSVGTFEALEYLPGDAPYPGFAIRDTAWGLVEPETDCDSYWVARTVLHSDKQGKSNVIAQLLTEVGSAEFVWEITAQQGFLVYFLAFEEVELKNMGDLEDAAAWVAAGVDTSELEVNDSSNLRLRVKGFFEDEVMKSPRAEKPQDVNGDGITDIILPAGRWVLPDDYPTIAFGKLLWDLMDTPIDNIVSELDINADKFETLGDYWDMTKHVAAPTVSCYTDLVAECDVIGPFSKLEPIVADEDLGTIWDVTQQPEVPADGNLIDGYVYSTLCRTTVVPDGSITVEDANMPPAEILFVVTDGAGILTQVNKGDIYQRPETCATAVGVVYTNPYYWQEIPANPIIPPLFGSGLAGYEWDSWGRVGDVTIDGPYRFWDGLNVWTSDEILVMNVFDLSTVPTVLKAYTDNRGEAWVKFTQKAFDSSTIEAFATYPYLIGDHLPVVSNPVIKLSVDQKDIVLYVDDVDPVDPIRKMLYVFVRDYDGTPATCEKVEWLIDGPWGVLESLLEDTDEACINACYPVDYWDCEDAFIAGDGRSAVSCTRDMTAAEITEFVTDAVFASEAIAEDYAIAGVKVLSSHLEDVNISIKIHDCWDGEIFIMTEDQMVEFTEDNPDVEVGLATIMDYVVIVYSYKAGEGVEGWTVFNPEWVTTHPEWNTLTTLYQNRGYWIDVTTACTLTYETQSYELDVGWNMIGWGGA